MKKRLLIFAFIVSFIVVYTNQATSFALSNKQTSCQLPAELKVEIEKQDASATNIKDGSIKIMVTGGIAPYRIVCYSPDSNPIVINNSNAEIEAVEGNYIIVIQDKTNKYLKREINISVRK